MDVKIKTKLEKCMNERFLIHTKIGSGSFGAVYSGFDQTLKRLVAIKVETKIHS